MNRRMIVTSMVAAALVVAIPFARAGTSPLCVSQPSFKCVTPGAEVLNDTTGKAAAM